MEMSGSFLGKIWEVYVAGTNSVVHFLAERSNCGTDPKP